MAWQEIVTLVALLLVGGPLASWLIQWAKKSKWPDWFKAGLAYVVSFAVGLAGAWLAGDILGLVAKWGELTAVDLIAAGTVVWTGATGFFYLYWQPRQRAEAQRE